jgi:HK97 family phage portal protein
MNLNPFKRKKPPEEKAWVNTDQGFMDQSWDPGWWQQDKKPYIGRTNEAVEACVATLAQTVAMCPVHHLEDLPSGETRRLVGSNAERVLLNPNDYCTRASFFNTIIRCMYYSADGYAIAQRNSTGSIRKLFVTEPTAMEPMQDPETGDVFYWASPTYGRVYNPDTDNIYPARDVLHLRINVNTKNPLKGETPLTAAANSIAANTAIVGHQAQFFNNMARPSGVLSTDQLLNKDQMTALRQAFQAQSQKSDSGGVAILGNGLKFQSMSLSSQDSQIIEAFGMTVESISRVFRVPLQLINSMTGATFNNAEATMRWFLASGMGFLLENIELELSKLFGLPFNERLNFDTVALLRSDWKTQIETLGEGVLKGIYSPDEARAKVGLGPVPNGAGAEPRVQQQVVPLSAWEQTLSTPAPAPQSQPEDDTEDDTEDDAEMSLYAGIMKGKTYGN